jgi:ligand-binding sensor domain-containing protein
MLLNVTFGKTLFGLALTVISYFVLPSAYGQFAHTSFVPVAPAELSSTFVRCVYKDSRGFMWFGTATGLIRFDGTSVFRYETDQVNGSAVVSNSINAIIEDDKSNLWIGTANGLALYNLSEIISLTLI